MMKRIIVYIFCAAAIGGITITPHVHCKNNVHKHRDPLERLSDTKTGRSTAEESFRKLEHPRSVEDGDAIDITNKPTEGELNPLIIFGSSNSTGNTWKTICAFNTDGLIPVVDLNTLDITPYDYAHKNKDDDYLPLMERIMHHNPIILATPVYWYTPSAVMKTFIDRLSDLLTIRKDLGRGLANKDLYVITSYGARKVFIQVKPDGIGGLRTKHIASHRFAVVSSKIDRGGEFGCCTDKPGCAGTVC